MKGIDKITDRIEADAVADAAVIAQEAKDQCDAIRADGEKKAQEHYWQKAQEGMKAVEERVQRYAKAADMEARKNVLACKQELVAEAFQQAEEKFHAMENAKYIEFLAGQAARAAVTGEEELVLREEDRRTCGSKILARANELLRNQGKPGHLTIANENGQFCGGLIVRKGSISVNCTISALMDQAREDLASDVAAELFA